MTAKTYDGTLTIDGKRLRFRPSIWPTTTAKNFGFRWNKPIRAWTAPLNFSRVSQIAREFHCEWSPELRRWRAAQLDNSVEDLGIFAKDLYSFQTDAVRFLCSRYHRGSGAFLLLEPGLGKTVVAIRAIEALNLRPICWLGQLSFLANIRALIRRWSIEQNPSISICHGGWVPSRWMLANYETLVRHPPKYRFALVVADESVLLKNRHAKRTKAVAALARKQKCPVWLLSGGPTTKWLDDLWSQLNIIDSKRFRSYWRFARTYTQLQTNQWGTSVIANQRDALAWLKEDLADLWFARTQNQVLDIPEFLGETFTVQMNEEQNRIYSEMESKFEVWLQNADGATHLLAPNVLVQLLRLLQIASNPHLIGSDAPSAKIVVLADLLPRIKLPAVIWTAFIETAAQVQRTLKELGYCVDSLTGKTKPADRQKVVDRVQAGKLDILVAHPAVGKYSFTLTKIHTAIYLERTFSTDDYHQSMYRIRRIGTTARPHVVYMLSQKQDGRATIDHIVHRVLSTKREITKSLTVGWLQQEWGKNV